MIGSYPGQSFHTKNISIPFEPECLYHYRRELVEASKEFEPGSEGARHVPILLQFINEQFRDCIAETENLLEQNMIVFEHLWTIFKPGTLIYSLSRGQRRVYELNSYQYSVRCQTRTLDLNVSYVDYDGDDFGTRSTTLVVPDFDGAQKIADLSAFPLRFHDCPEDVKRALIARGRRWESYAGQNFCEYTGIATSVDDFGRLLRFNIQGRVMIDCKTFHRLETNQSFAVDGFSRTSKEAMRKRALNDTDIDLVPESGEELLFMTDEQCLLASATVRGFSFTEKKFMDFFVDKLSPIEWNDRCFEQLVLPANQKDTVQALVAEHTTAPSSGAFDDIVKNKGRGLILVLHGPPGVGKTLTAECVAEFSHRPLYIVSSGDLGTHSSVLDTQLSRIMDLASTWKAVLLIDEADVFLERRSLHDMERNSLVSIFLRTLEYYSGILFMTTNRVRTFDDAFKSRIHVPLRYDELPQSSRVQIWKNFLAKVQGGVDIDEDGYDELSKGELNGRQIKNVIRTAKSLASYRRQRLGLAGLKQVMEIQVAFERELDAAAADGKVDVVER